MVHGVDLWFHKKFSNFQGVSQHMRIHLNRAASTLGLAVLVCFSVVVPALAQVDDASAVSGPVRAHYTVMPPKLQADFGIKP